MNVVGQAAAIRARPTLRATTPKISTQKPSTPGITQPSERVVNLNE